MTANEDMVPDVDIPNPFSRSTLYFLMLLVGACVMFAGTGVWFVTADMDYHFSFTGQVEDDSPRYTDVVVYDNLPPEQQEMFHAAVEDGQTFGVEDASGVPDAEAIYYQERYYIFTINGYYDWLNPETSVPVLVGFTGLAMMVDAARRDHLYHP